MGNPQEVVQGSDIVVTATASLSRPVLFITDQWFDEGSLAMPLDGSSVCEPRPIPSVDRFVCDAWPRIEAKVLMECFLVGCRSSPLR